MLRHARWGACCVVLLAAIGAPSAAVVPENWEFEVYGGMADSGFDFLDDDVVYGVRAGYNFSENFNLHASVGHFTTDDEITELGFTGDLEFTETYVDVSAMLHLIPDKPFNPQLFAGIGYSFVSVDAEITGPGGTLPSTINGEDDSFTAHGGVGLRIDLGKTVYLNAQLRLRWYEARDQDETSTEYTLGVGFKLGS